MAALDQPIYLGKGFPWSSGLLQQLRQPCVLVTVACSRLGLLKEGYSGAQIARLLGLRRLPVEGCIAAIVHVAHHAIIETETASVIALFLWMIQ